MNYKNSCKCWEHYLLRVIAIDYVHSIDFLFYLYFRIKKESLWFHKIETLLRLRFNIVLCINRDGHPVWGALTLTFTLMPFLFSLVTHKFIKAPKKRFTEYPLRLQASKGSNVCQLPKKFFVAHFEVPIWVGKLAKKIFDFGEPCGRGTRLKLRYP